MFVKYTLLVLGEPARRLGLKVTSSLSIRHSKAPYAKPPHSLGQPVWNKSVKQIPCLTNISSVTIARLSKQRNYSSNHQWRLLCFRIETSTQRVITISIHGIHQKIFDTPGISTTKQQYSSWHGWRHSVCISRRATNTCTACICPNQRMT